MKQKKENNGKTEEDSRTVLRGELALLIVVLINSLGVVLMLQSGSGISAISSVPYAFSLVLPKLSLGTWTYIFQGLLVVSLMILQKRFVPQYLFSFVVGFAFSEMLDVHKLWISGLPMGLGWQLLYLVSLWQTAVSCRSFRRIFFPGIFPISSEQNIRESRFPSM